MNVGVIGGSDGPTVIFVSDNAPDWFNPFGLLLVIAILIPNIIYALRHKEFPAAEHAKLLIIAEQIGRYACMFLMVINLSGFGIMGGSFSSSAAFMLYLFGCPAAALLYWIVWVFYSGKRQLFSAMLLAILPSSIFLICGITRSDWPLTAAAVLFSISHTAITWQSHC